MGLEVVPKHGVPHSLQCLCCPAERAARQCLCSSHLTSQRKLLRVIKQLDENDGSQMNMKLWKFVCDESEVWRAEIILDVHDQKQFCVSKFRNSGKVFRNYVRSFQPQGPIG